MQQADFIEVFDDALDAASCAAIIERFEQSGESVPGAVGSGVMPELKDSADIQISGKPQWQDVELQLNQAVHSALIAYLRRYPHTLIAPLMLQRQDPKTGVAKRIEAEDFADMDDRAVSGLIGATLRPGAINLQRYRADQGGYPYWHCELYPKAGSIDPLHRVLLWTVYLNDGFAEGETEFLYQQRRITPKTGSLLLAPTTFTHTHRGNRPRGGDKYIATSWVLFNPAEQLFGKPG